jgi:hypothetical protein
MAEPRTPKFRRGEYVRFVPDHQSFGQFILSDQMRDPVVEVCEDIAALAGQYAPRRKAGIAPDGTAMADRFKVNREAGTMKVDRAHRVKVEVYNEAASAAPNEFGNKRNTRHRMLGRAGAAFGDFKQGKGKQGL